MTEKERDSLKDLNDEMRIGAIADALCRIPDDEGDRAALLAAIESLSRLELEWVHEEYLRRVGAKEQA